jgi:hypothetical protein
MIDGIDAHDCDNLDRTQPKFELTKELDTKVINGDDGDKEDGHPYTRIDLFISFPFLNDQGGCCKLIWRGDDVLAPVRPSKSKSKSRVTKAGSVASKTRRVRNPRSHFTEGRHDNVDEKTDRSVSDEN